MSFQTFFDNQIDVKRLLDNSFNKDRLSQVYLFVGPKGVGKMDGALYLASLILGLEEESVKKNSNVHIITPDNDNFKKDQIEELLEEFSLTSDTKDIFIIDGIDKANAKVANHLLKFLEELKEGSFGILLAQDKASVLPTITSRSVVVHFLPLNRNSIKEELQTNGVGSDIALAISNLTYNVDTALAMAKDDEVLNSINLAMDVAKAIETDEDIHTLLMIKGKELIDSQEKSYHLAFFDTLISLEEDKIKALSSGNASYDVVKNLDITLSIEEEIDILELILKAKDELKYNVNKTLLYTSLFIKIKRC